ncbi:MAG: DNA-binding protein [Halioglobus sp.]|nr:DNA-binding protein [Halioglobus sp.]
MKLYEFTLKFSFPDEDFIDDIDELVERLGEAGGDDALVGIGKTGRLALDFSREAESAFDAISSAIANVKTAIPEAKVTEATPDLVGLTDVADILGCSRQNMRKLMIKSGSNFPAPIYQGKSSLWHLFSVLSWLVDSRSYDVEEQLIDISRMNMHLNLARELHDVDESLNKEVYRLVS